MDIRMHYGSVTVANWNDIRSSVTSIADLIDFETGLGTSRSLSSRSGAFNQTPISAGGSPGTGDAAWVNAGTITANSGSRNGGTHIDIFSGFAVGESVTVQFYAINSSGSNETTVTVNGDTKSLPTANNLSNILQFNTTADASGNVSVEWGSATTSYAASLRFIDTPTVPSITLSAPPQLGATLSGTYANFGGTPTGPIQLDQGARSLPDEAITVTAGTESWVTDTALPGLPANGESVTPFPLIGVGIDITLPDPGV